MVLNVNILVLLIFPFGFADPFDDVAESTYNPVERTVFVVYAQSGVLEDEFSQVL